MARASWINNLRAPNITNGRPHGFFQRPWNLRFLFEYEVVVVVGLGLRLRGIPSLLSARLVYISGGGKKTKWRARTWNVLPTERRRSSGKKKKLLLLSTCTSTAVYLAGNTFSIYHVGGSVVYRVQARLYLSGR